APMPDGAPPAARHARCGWFAPWESVGVQTFIANASFFDVVHPDWYYIASDAVSLTAIAGADDPQVLQAAAAQGVRIGPLVSGVDYLSTVRQMMNDATLRTTHVQKLVELAVSHNYAGLDIDYEGLWSASDRVPYQTFLTQLADAMHAAGKSV